MKKYTEEDLKFMLGGKDEARSYDIWLAEGYEGTIQDFLKWLRGDDSYTPTEGLEYTLLADGTYEVTGIGSARDCDIMVPSTYEGKNVTNIGDYAFSFCKSLISITIGKNVTSIGANAFRNCKSLTSITIGKNVISIGDNAFAGCYKLVEVCNLSDLTIEVGSTDYGNVGKYAKNIYKTEDYTSKLSTTEDGYILHTEGDEVILVGYIGSKTELVLPNNVTKINANALCDCESLTSVTICDGVTSIGNEAFSGCESLTSITIPDSVLRIGNEAFSWCDSLTSVTFDDTSAWYYTSNSNHTGGTAIDVKDTLVNANNLTSLHTAEYWYKL